MTSPFSCFNFSPRILIQSVADALFVRLYLFIPSIKLSRRGLRLESVKLEIMGSQSEGSSRCVLTLNKFISGPVNKSSNRGHCER
jgi:hypothetical protein